MAIGLVHQRQVQNNLRVTAWRTENPERASTISKRSYKKHRDKRIDAAVKYARRVRGEPEDEK